MSLIVHEVGYIYSKGTAYEKTALENINIQIGEGEFIGIIGHTGSGKSTLIQHMNGLLRPTSGTVYYNGEDIWDGDYSLKKLRSKIGLVFQYPEYQLFENSVIEDVKFGPRNIGISPLEVDLHSYEALKQVGIGEDLLDVSPLELSGGQRRRVAIAGVLAMQPEVLVLDEPTAGLDPKGRDEIFELLTELHEKRNITIILVSHSMEDVARYVDRLIVMNQGTIAYDGATEEVFSYHNDLEKIGLMAPQVTYVMEELARRGVKLPYHAITVEQAANSIWEAWKRQKD